ncbi:tyrosine-type recombinase/integrase [Marinomonas sp.]
MARLELINVQSMKPVLSRNNRKIIWQETNDYQLSRVPQIFFSDGEPWSSANRYAIDQLNSGLKKNYKTVSSFMSHLKAYASWLELEGVDWRYFPKKKKDRCLVRYRGFLVRQRDQGEIAPSTATARMSSIVRFYHWAKLNGFIEKKELWENKVNIVKFFTKEGLERTIAVNHTELSIPSRKPPGELLEGGLLPLSVRDRDTLLKFLLDNEKHELYLMFLIGFFTGARSETIRTLQISTLYNIQKDPLGTEIVRISVGPGTKVKTKYGVKGDILIPFQLIEQLKYYANSVRRLTRQSRSSGNDSATLFLTERGNTYSDTSFTKLISDLRKELISSGLLQFKHLKFHQSRASFGTGLMQIVLDTLPRKSDAIVFVRDAMLHKNESTTWKYIRFIENEPIKAALSDEFFDFFMGNDIGLNRNKVIDEVTYDS